MAETVELVAQPREAHGSRAAQRLRKKGLIPAVVYGHQEATIAVALPAEELARVIRHNVHIVDLKTDGKTGKALIREAQWDHLGKELLHVDFARVGADERVVVTVPIEVRGTAPGLTQGGVLDQPIHSIAVECPVVNVPDSVRVNVSELQLGQAIHVRDLHLPEGIKAMGDPDLVIVHVTLKAVEAAAAAAEAAESAEPEVIGRKAAAEEGEEEK